MNSGEIGGLDRSNEKVFLQISLQKNSFNFSIYKYFKFQVFIVLNYT